MLLQNALDLYLAASACSTRTLRDRLQILGAFVKHFGNQTIDIDIQAIKEYMADWPVSFVTYNIRRRYLHAFFNWLYLERFIDCNPVKFIRPLKPDRRNGEKYPHELNKGLPRDLVLMLLKRYHQAPDKHLLCFALLCETGCRPGEAIRLLKDDIHLSYCTIRDCKNGSDIHYAYNPRFGQLLLNYIKSVGSQWAFPATLDPQKHMSYNTFSGYFKKNIQKGFKHPETGSNITLHQLRHTVITNRASYLTPHELARLSGHNDIRTSMIYTNRSVDFMQTAYAKVQHLSYA